MKVRQSSKKIIEWNKQPLIFSKSIHHYEVGGLGNKPTRKSARMEINPILIMNFGRENLFGCDSFISSPTGR